MYIYYLVINMDVHNENLTNTLKCTLCVQVYSTKYNLDRHIANVHGVNIEKNKIGKNCNICQKMFSRSTTLRSHIKEVHKIYGICSE